AVADARVLFACAARPGEMSDNPAALKMMRGLAREGRSTSIELGPLDPAAITEIARRLSPSVDADRVVRESEGNPLLALELSRAGAYQKLAEPSRRAVHRTIARALGSNGIEPARANEVAHHATLGGDAELAVRAALAAAQRCLRMFAKEEAVRLADMGLAQL